MPYPEWGETDFLLTIAVDLLDDMRCPCGCGQWADVAHDEDTEDRWAVTADTTCYARKALVEFHEQHKDLDPAAQVSLRLLADGEPHPGRFDPGTAREWADALHHD